MNFEAEKEKQSLVTDRNYCILSTKYPAKQLDSLGLMLSVWTPETFMEFLTQVFLFGTFPFIM